MRASLVALLAAAPALQAAAPEAIEIVPAEKDPLVTPQVIPLTGSPVVDLDVGDSLEGQTLRLRGGAGGASGQI